MKEVGNIEIRSIKALKARCMHSFSYLPVLEFLLKSRTLSLLKGKEHCCACNYEFEAGTANTLLKGIGWY